MSKPPIDLLEFWIRFLCSFLFFGFLFALLLLRFMDTLGWFGSLGAWLTITSTISLYAARTGDDAWSRIISCLRWW